VALSETDTNLLEERALAPLRRTTWKYWVWLAFLVCVLGWGVYAYSHQLTHGLAVTGMANTQNRILWGLYIVNFVFFIGISHAGTLISAILRASQARWRTAITRMAEFITVVALCVGGLLPMIDLGRPDRLFNVFRYGRWQSPILWDFLAITTYLVGSLLYLYLPLVPDLALVRDTLEGKRRWFYGFVSLGWNGSDQQKRLLHRGIGMMMVVIIPVAISVHTVVSWIFGMTLRVGWNTAVFGVYFVAGAIFSGIAVLVLMMTALRRIFRLDPWITIKHYKNLGYLLAVLGVIMAYFNISEFLTAGYKMSGNEPVYFSQVFRGQFAPLYWVYVLAMLSPGMVMLIRPFRRIGAIVGVSVLVAVGMWIERYIIVVATLRTPQMPYANLVNYLPSWVELSVSAGLLALFMLIITVFVKIFPVVSVWELEEPAHETVEEVLPGTAGTVVA
jgi:molybdopterin-containing oxidoreductase family membrane subunit